MITIVIAIIIGVAICLCGVLIGYFYAVRPGGELIIENEKWRLVFYEDFDHTRQKHIVFRIRRISNLYNDERSDENEN